MTIESDFDVSFVAALSLKEKQIQQNYRPIIAIHKWFARRPGTLFRALTLAEFGDRPLSDTFFRPQDFSGLKVADPFMGGGTPLIEANRVGCDIHGFDINPMATWIVREAIEHLDLDAYTQATAILTETLRSQLDDYYRTDCPQYGDTNVPVKYFLWVKVLNCESCGEQFDLFPGYLISENKRHPQNVMVCPDCGDINEVEDRHNPGDCKCCSAALTLIGPARRNRCACSHCGHINTYPRQNAGPPGHRLFAIEYFNPARKAEHRGRFFKKPDTHDLARVEAAFYRAGQLTSRFIPEQEILPGDETDRLHRWGYKYYRDMFNPRQLLALELSCRLISEINEDRIRHALATNLSDLLRYQNMLCRYDTMALKSLDIFSVHGFPVGLVQCESNILGITNGKGNNVGSGGWSNIIDKYTKAKRYCDAPFEVRKEGSRNIKMIIDGEWIGERLNGCRTRDIQIHCATSTSLDLPPQSLDAVFTDPPYFGNVQYGELMDFCYVWLRRLVGEDAEGFHRVSTRSPDELTGNVTQNRGLAHFTDGLSAVYSRMARALKPGAPLAFTYHHNKIEAYYAVGVAILDSGLTCSASLPCPAEMGGSIHIHGTGSSIVDTVFVCRTPESVSQCRLFDNPEQLAVVMFNDIRDLENAGRTPTRGDTRCILFGHLTRMAIWNLRCSWQPELPTDEKLVLFSKEVSRFGDPENVFDLISMASKDAAKQRQALRKKTSEQEVQDAFAF